MPVSEKHQVDLLGRQSGDSIAGVPFKKRRYLVVRSPSPPPHRSSDLPNEPGIPQSDQSILKPKTHVSPHRSSDLPNEPGILQSDQSILKPKTHVSPHRSSDLPNEPGIPQSHQSSLKPKTHVSSIAITAHGHCLEDEKGGLTDNKETSIGLNLKCSTSISSSGKETDRKGDLIPEDASTLQLAADGSGLVFPTKEPSRLPLGEEMSEGKPLMSNKSVTENDELISTLKVEPLGLPIVGHSIGLSCPEEEDMHRSPQVLVGSAFDIYRGKQKGCDTLIKDGYQTEGNFIKTKQECTDLHASRSHWDLNTTMDTWEGSSSDKSSNHAADRINMLVPSAICDIKPVECLKVMAPSELKDNHIVSVKYALNDSNHNTDEMNTLVPSGNCDIKPVACLKDIAPKESKDTHLSHLKYVHNESKDTEQLPICSMHPDEDCNSKASCSLQVFINQRPLCSSPAMNTMEGVFDKSMSEKRIVSTNNLRDDHKHIKSEYGWGVQEDVGVAGGQNLELMKLRTPKAEVLEGSSQDVVQTVDSYNPRLVHQGIKSEPVEESKICSVRTREGMPCQLEIHKLSEEMSISGDVAQEVGESIVCALDLPYESAVPNAAESVATDHMPVDVNHGGSSVSSEVTGSDDDDEKINISADIHEDDPYDSDYESDGSPVTDTVMRQANDDNDDYEDGEVREPLGCGTSVESKSGEGMQLGDGDPSNKKADVSAGSGGDSVITSTNAECRDDKGGKPGERINTLSSGLDNITKKEQGISAVPCLKKSSPAGCSTTAGSGKKTPIKIIRRIESNCSGQKEHGSKVVEKKKDHLPSASGQTDVGKDSTVNKHDSVKGSKLAETSHLNVPQTEASLKVDETSIDVTTRNNRSRIINLARASDGPSSGRTRSFMDGPVALRIERGRTAHTSFRVDKLHPCGSRDGRRFDAPRKFIRDRNIDLVSGNSGMEFVHMKGRDDSSLDAVRGDCDPGRDFTSRHTSNLTVGRFPRPKNSVATVSAELECNGLLVADGSVVSSRKPWRKHVHGELERFHHPSFRRRSPSGRDGPMPLGLRMVRGPPRVTSPDRCIGRGGPDTILVRREEKFMRNLPDDMMADTLFSHPQSQYQQVHNPFIRRDRSFSPPIQRRVPQICSKSPQRSRTRSPCAWPSPRRSPDQFDGHPELLLHRSPPIFRGERARSPCRGPCFGEDIMVRRHGTPPHMSQMPDGLRKMGPFRREHDHPRPFILNRSPSGRILQRNTRRYDMIDPRERVEGDEYYGPMRSGRFNDIVIDECVDDRGKFQRGPIRSFRPNDVGDDEEFYYREDDPRPRRFCPEADAVFHERGNPRDPERRVMNRLGNPRRPRSVEEQVDDNRYSGGQEWGEASFNGAVRRKRGRF